MVHTFCNCCLFSFLILEHVESILKNEFVDVACFNSKTNYEIEISLKFIYIKKSHNRKGVYSGALKLLD